MSKSATITVTGDIQRMLPLRVRRQAGIKVGDQLEVRASGGIVTLVPKLPSAGDEYTPEQRRSIDAQIAEGLEDVHKGRVSPHFPESRWQESLWPTEDSASMKWQHSNRSKQDYNDAPLNLQKAFDKQARLLAENLRHPSGQENRP